MFSHCSDFPLNRFRLKGNLRVKYPLKMAPKTEIKEEENHLCGTAQVFSILQPVACSTSKDRRWRLICGHLVFDVFTAVDANYAIFSGVSRFFVAC